MKNDRRRKSRRGTGAEQSKNKLLNGGLDPAVIGGATQFKPGQSGNPSGKASRLETVLSLAARRQLGTLAEDGRTYAARMAENAVLIVDKALELGAKTGRIDRSIVAFYSMIQDRDEGKPTQPVKDVTDDFASRSNTDLAFFIEHGHWPEQECNSQHSSTAPTLGQAARARQ